jgi:LysR family glycine cleavage system transcriptional activator
MVKRRLLPSFSALQAFEAAARHGNFTRAAEELNLTQGAISRQVKGLEESLGIVLFDRVRQRVVLTELGRSYLDDVRRTLDSLEASSKRAMEMAGGSETLEIATLPTFCSRWLIPRLADFHAGHPGIAINFTSRFVPFDLREDKFDLVIHIGSAVWPGATLHPLFPEQMVVCASPRLLARHPIHDEADIALAALLQQTTRPDAWADWFRMVGETPHAAHRGPRYDQFSMVARAAVAGLGLAILPEFFIAEELARGQLVLVSERRLPYGNYYLVVPEEKISNITVLRFKNWLLDQASLFS